MKKIVSILLTLAVAVSLLVVPAMVSAADYTVGGSTIQVTSIAPCGTLDEACFDAEPETLVLLDGITFDAQTSGVVIAGAVSALDLGAGWVDTAYVEIGLRPDATKDERNAGVYLIAFNTGEKTWIHLQDYTGSGNENVFDIGKDSAFKYEITLVPSGSVGGTATLEVWVSDISKGTVSLGYGYASDWQERTTAAPMGNVVEDFSDAHLFYSIIADRRGTEGETYSATVGNITISGDDISGSTVGVAANVLDIVAISVTPTNINFGTLKPGGNSAIFDIYVENIGTHTVNVNAKVTGASSPLFKDDLWMMNNGSPDWNNPGPWDLITNLAMDTTDDVQTRLKVSSAYSPGGSESGTLLFTASTA